ncbi:MAG: hypothetical protein V3V05_03460 [Pontiella sp.]
MPNPHPRKSGQAIIFLMVVMVIGLLAVVWNFDLHRVISAKLRMRNAGDSAAMAAARWQGHSLNMIGDLNLIQAAILSLAYEEYQDALSEWEDAGGEASGEPEPEFEDYYDLAEMEALHELRLRIEFVGPLAGFAVAQQTAFNNGALPDPRLAANLVDFAADLRDEVARQPYDNAFDEYADLLDMLVFRGVAVSSYSLRLRNHPLTNEEFYGAIAQALADWWCPMYAYRDEMENYEDFESWTKLDTEFRYNFMFDLQLDEFTMTLSTDGYDIPNSAMLDGDDYTEEFGDFITSNEVIEAFGSSGFAFEGMLEALDVEWHVYNNSWARPWPRPAEYDDETNPRRLKPLAIHSRVKTKYNYLGAVSGISMSAEVGRGILASSDNETVDLSYRAKAKPFGFLNLDAGQEPPHYFGFVFPAFEEVRLVHFDIGNKVLSGVFYEHVTRHLESYLDRGPEATNPQCSYCQLLVKWEELNFQDGLEWLERAYNDDRNNPCDPEDDGYDPVWGDAGGGATGGS